MTAQQLSDNPEKSVSEQRKSPQKAGDQRSLSKIDALYILRLSFCFIHLEVEVFTVSFRESISVLRFLRSSTQVFLTNLEQAEVRFRARDQMWSIHFQGNRNKDCTKHRDTTVLFLNLLQEITAEILDFLFITSNKIGTKFLDIMTT